MISVSGLTLTYPSGKGIFNLNFEIAQGVVTGYLGPNGAGKTTTIRALMGFMRPNNGKCSIGGLDCIEKAPQIQKNLGYIPGEIAYPDGMNGDEFLEFISEMRGIKFTPRKNELLDMFELSPKGKIKRFSKGMKQKLAIVSAFMHDPEVLVLDEPSSGLDPLMQNRFVDLIVGEKDKGKTILLSSHIFEEVEKICDQILIIKEGRIVEQADVQKLKGSQRRVFILKPQDVDDAIKRLKTSGFDGHITPDKTCEVYVTGGKMDSFVKTISQFTVLELNVKHQSLEDVFMDYYSKEVKGS